MDVPALLVFVSGFVVCAGVVFLISIFGAKEETFEEALAKQRKANEKEKKSKDKKKDENSGKKSKNWRMKKKGERDDKQDGLVSDLFFWTKCICEVCNGWILGIPNMFKFSINIE